MGVILIRVRVSPDEFGVVITKASVSMLFIVCRNSFLNVLKPDVSKVELLKDVQSKQDLLVRLVTHDIQVNEDDEDEDIEEIVLEESPLMDRGDEFEFEKQHGVKAHYWKNSAYSDLNLEKKSTLLSLDRKENVWQETSKYNSCVLGAANLSNSDLRKETHTPGVSHRSVGEAGRNRGRSGITRAVIALDSSSEENYHVEAAKRDLVKCGNSDLVSESVFKSEINNDCIHFDYRSGCYLHTST
ncbi:hypothetical protein NDU88_003948 [Pleurodeles waltl]|uniref:Fibrous sheath-interacting protein 2 C-terminal domain-containing protein n=1 Tax=Pleurodeles waltl TaxID=8319 RepID=A0AAV7VGT7_PLEWA|nr:hypothetical protein NDU88_003948 [Pleurodeles waltl]